MKYFDYNGFKQYYLAKSKLDNKNNLVDDFRNEWSIKFGFSKSLTRFVQIEVKEIKSLFTAANKKDLKVRLISRGYSSQAIDSLFKYFADWLKACK